MKYLFGMFFLATGLSWSLTGRALEKQKPRGFEVDGGSAGREKRKKAIIIKMSDVGVGSLIDLSKFFANKANHRDFKVSNTKFGNCQFSGTGYSETRKGMPQLYRVYQAIEGDKAETVLKLNSNIEGMGNLSLKCPAKMSVDELKKFNIEPYSINPSNEEKAEGHEGNT